MQENTIHLYRATLLSFFSIFEAYLEEQLQFLKKHRGGSWGPFVRSLSDASLTKAEYPVQLRTVLCADTCREIRNRIVHKGFWVPSSPDDETVFKWKQELQKRACQAGWPKEEAEAEIQVATDMVIGNAAKYVEDAKELGKTLPVELFYMLFTFTNLDSLAFEIEEARQPLGYRSKSKIRRRGDAIRRKDLIITEEPDLSSNI
jgi:hypothetical protein